MSKSQLPLRDRLNSLLTLGVLAVALAAMAVAFLAGIVALAAIFTVFFQTLEAPQQADFITLLYDAIMHLVDSLKPMI